MIVPLISYGFLASASLLTIYLLFALLHKQRVSKKPAIYWKSDGDFAAQLRAGCSVLFEEYTPPWWCPFGIVQTIVRAAFPYKPNLHFEREIVRFDDGGQLGVDWAAPTSGSSNGSDDTTPVVILLPGITGSTHDSPYILHIVSEALSLGFKCCVVNPRGLGGVRLLTKRTYNAAETHDIREVVKMVNARFPTAPKLGVGFSMGGMILWNYLATCKTAKDAGMQAAMIISSPFDPMDATWTIEQPIPRILFNRHLANNLKRVVLPYKSLFEEVLDWKKVENIKTVRDFDKAFVVPLFGYSDWTEYYHDAALNWKVDRIPIRTLCLNAADDCFSPLKSLPLEKAQQSETVVIAVTEAGGHTAHMEGTNPNQAGYIERLFRQFSQLTLL